MFSFKVSVKALTWFLRFYPPLFLGGIWVEYIDPDYKTLRVRISKTLINSNANGSIYGGSLYLATDPFYVVLFHQYFNQKGYTTKAWLKRAEIEYVTPAFGRVYFNFRIKEEDFQLAEDSLNRTGKYIRIHEVDGYNKKGELCIRSKTEVYIRDLHFQNKGENTPIS